MRPTLVLVALIVPRAVAALSFLGLGPKPKATDPSSSALVPVPLARGQKLQETPRGPRFLAVTRLLQIEYDRLSQAMEIQVALMREGVAPWDDTASNAPSMKEVLEEMEARRPMIRWATRQWLVNALGINRPGVWCPQLKKWELHPWQWVPKGHPTLTTPTLAKSLRVLRPQLTAEVRRGFRSSPLRVCRLAYRALLVYLLAAIADIPGPQKALIQRTWPKCVDHLAAMLEYNHELNMQQIRAEIGGEATGEGSRRSGGRLLQIGSEHHQRARQQHHSRPQHSRLSSRRNTGKGAAAVSIGEPVAEVPNALRDARSQPWVLEASLNAVQHGWQRIVDVGRHSRNPRDS